MHCRRRLAAAAGVSPSKKWGQNFVIDPNTVRRIVDDAHVTAADTVLEVGPGLGSLTLALLPAAGRVVCVEVDQRLADMLPDIGYVPAGVVELMKKQKEGWAYIRP